MKTILCTFFALFLTASLAFSQDTLYVYKAGAVAYKSLVSAVDSITFKKGYSGTVTDIDGNVYYTVIIGTQTWIAANLKTTKYRNGDVIDNVSLSSNWSALTTGAWCDYNNDSANGTTYGHLYNWYAVNDSRNIAPTGWHVATDAEWTTLENYLIANGYNYDGTTTGDKTAKSLAATSLWTTSTTTGAVGNDLTKNNSSGFTALPGGYRDATGTYSSLNIYTYWWSSTEASTTTAEFRYINSANVDLHKNPAVNKKHGMSVRCVKDQI